MKPDRKKLTIFFLGLSLFAATTNCGQQHHISTRTYAPIAQNENPPEPAAGTATPATLDDFPDAQEFAYSFAEDGATLAIQVGGPQAILMPSNLSLRRPTNRSSAEPTSGDATTKDGGQDPEVVKATNLRGIIDKIEGNPAAELHLVLHRLSKKDLQSLMAAITNANESLETDQKISIEFHHKLLGNRKAHAAIVLNGLAALRNPNKITSLQLRGLNLRDLESQLGETIGNFTRLKTLAINHANLRSLNRILDKDPTNAPGVLGKLTALQHLDLSFNNATEKDYTNWDIVRLAHLQSFNMSFNRLGHDTSNAVLSMITTANNMLRKEISNPANNQQKFLGQKNRNLNLLMRRSLQVAISIGAIALGVPVIFGEVVVMGTWAIATTAKIVATAATSLAATSLVITNVQIYRFSKALSNAANYTRIWGRVVSEISTIQENERVHQPPSGNQ